MVKPLFAVAGATILSSVAGAAVLFDNGYANADGGFSDALSSNGAYFYEQTLGDDFALSSNSTITQIEFWGSSENFWMPDLSNMSGWEINILDSSFAVVHNAIVPKAMLSPTATGSFNVLDGEEYKFTYSTSIALNAGNYYLNIGAVLIGGGSDAFVWSSAPGPNSVKNVFDGNGWVVDSFDSSFVISGDAVPEPASMAALGLGVLALVRRRRSK